MNCELCNEPYNLVNNRPMELPCYNEAICKQCQEALVRSSENNCFNCPFTSCGERNSDTSIFKQCNGLIKVLQKSVGIYCETHQTKKAKFYCRTHNNLVCQLCIADFPKQHSTVMVEKKHFQDYNRIILEKLRAQIGRLESLIKEIESYQKGDKVFDSKQYMNMMNEVEGNLIYSERNEEERLRLKLVNHLPQPMNAQIQPVFKSDLIKEVDFSMIYSWFTHPVQLEQIYDASQNGWRSLDFHRYCDKEGPTLAVIRSEYNLIFGGFASQSWQLIADCKYIPDDKAFIFSIAHKTKFDQKEGDTKKFALHFNSSKGPTFGNGHDIYISDNCNQNNSSYSYFGHTYITPNGIQYETDQAKNYLAGSYNFKVTGLEVFKVIY